MRVVTWCSALAVLLAAGPARGEEPLVLPPGVEAVQPGPWVPVGARLEYVVEPAARSACPGETTFREQIAARMGHDPFDPKKVGVPVGLVRVTVEREPGGFASTYAIVDAGGALAASGGGREVGVDFRACRDAVEDSAAAVVVTLTLAQLKLGERVRAAAQAPAPAPPAAPVCPSLPAVPQCEAASPGLKTTWEPPAMPGPDAPPGLGFRVGASVFGERFALAGGTVGVEADAGVRYSIFSGSIALKVDPSLASSTSQGSNLDDIRITGAAIPCLHYGYLSACGKVEIGQLLFPRAPAPTPPHFYGAAGLRAALELPAGLPSLFVRLSGEVLFAIDPVSVLHGEQIQYQSVGTAGGLGFGLLYAR